MPKQDPLPPSPLSSPYSPAHVSAASTCWGKTVGSFGIRKSYYMGPEGRMCQLVGKEEPPDHVVPTPYYKGQMDFEIVLGKFTGCNSPGRDSHYTSITASSKTSSLRRMWGSSCFRSEESQFNPLGIRRESEKISVMNDRKKKKKKQDADLMKDEPSSNEQSLTEKARLAAEKIPTMITSKKEEYMEGQKYIWADKYRPITLSNFISNQDKAYMLQRLGGRDIKICHHHVLSIDQGLKSRQCYDVLWLQKDKKLQFEDQVTASWRQSVAVWTHWRGTYRIIVNSGRHYDHFIFEGPPGVGKRTMARALVREVFGTHILETREAHKDFNLEEGQNSVRIIVEMSSHHIEVNISGLDKRVAAHVVMELIKEYSSAVTLNQKQLQCDNKSNVRAIIVCGAEKLSDSAQLNIGNHLETYRSHLKIYFCYSGTSMLQNLKSHCTVIQIPTPSKEEIVQVLQFVAECEAIELPVQLARNIADMSKHSTVRHAIRALEATCQSNYPFEEDQEPATGWEEEVAEIVENAIAEQSLEQPYIINQKIKRLKVHNVPAEIILKTFVGEMKKLLDDELLLKICDFCKNSGYYDFQNLTNENALSGGRMIDIEEFVAKFMSAYKKITQHQASD